MWPNQFKLYTIIRLINSISNYFLALITAIISIMTSVKLLSWIGGSLTSLNFFPWAKTKEKLQQFDDPLCKREMAERQIAERALAESEIFFQSIFENTAMDIALIDLDGHVVRMNPTYSQMLGYEEGELLNKHFREYTYKEDIPGDLEAFVQLQKLKYNQYQRTKRYLNKNGNLIWVNLTVSLVRDRQGEPQYAIAMMENITERKAAERELLETKERLERLVKARTEELIQINEELTWQIKHDHLTGLLNRYEFEQQLTALLKAKRRPNYEEEERENQSDSLCYLNLDRFKTVNETYGHLAGDELLRKVSMIIKACCRHSDTVARVGGDKFAILLYKCPLTEAETVAEKI